MSQQRENTRSAFHRPDLRILAYALVLVGIGAAMFGWTGVDALEEVAYELPWWLIVLGFFSAEASAIHLEIRRESYTLSLSSFPLLLGLLAVAPLALLAARLIGSFVALAAVRRRSGIKLVWNLALMVAETGVAVLVARLVLVDGPPQGWDDWLVLVAALFAADLVGLVAVPFVVMLAGGERQPDLLLQMSRTQALSLLSTAFAVVVAAAMMQTKEFLVLGIAPIIGVAVFSRLFGRLSQEHQDLQRIHGFTAATGSRDSLDVGLRELTSILRTRGSALAVATPDGRFAVRALVDDDYIDLTVPADSLLDPPGIIDLTDGATSTAPRALLDELGGSGGLGVRIHDVAEEQAFVVVFDRLGVTDSFGVEESRLFESIASTLGTRISADRLLERLELQAMIDGLTGLANRSTLEQEVETRLGETGRSGALLLLDLDRFKDVNDSLGHQFGDEMLRIFASRLTKSTRPGDLAARLGGDEFAVVLDATPQEMELALERLSAELGEPIELDGLSLELGVSIGVTEWPDGTDDASELLRKADIAMYEAKRTHQPWVRYAARIDHTSSDRLALLGQLREAIQHDELCIHLQPQVRVDDLSMVGAEALVRWQHPELGMLMPSEFVPLAEHSSLAGDLTACVLDLSAEAARRLRELGFDIAISVNLTSRDLLNRSVPDLAADVLRRYGLPASAIAFEVTESSLIVDIETATANLAALRELGCRTSVDDFGTGYASLRYLQQLPLDEVKIDRSFIAGAAHNRSDAAIVRSTSRLIKDLGLEVVAEGVEDEATLAFLREIGVDTLQGYLVSRPLPMAEFTDFALAARIK